MAPIGRPRSYHTNADRQRAYRQRQRQRVHPQGAGTPCVQIGDHVTLYQGDALSIAPTLQHIDAVIADPPYGTDYRFTKPRRSRTPLQPRQPAARWTDNIIGDDVPFDPTPWLGYPQVILWGADHYLDHLQTAGKWLVWDKRDGSTADAFSDVELAWTNLPGVNRLYRHKWRGLIREGEENVVHGGKLHPAQKPARLMAWCVAMTTGTVLDPYMGSGTTGLACLRLGRPFVGIEMDPHYFQVACDRLTAAARQGQLFPAPPEGGFCKGR